MSVWGILKFLAELWSTIKVLLGMVEKAKHEKAQKEIKDKADIIADPTKTEEEKLDAIKDIEDGVNSHT